MNLEGYVPGTVADADLLVKDRWILSRLATVTQQTTDALSEYRYADAAKALYGFAWDEFCSFYVEMVKARLGDEALRPTAQRVLAHVLDTLLRLLHPMIPFVTEEIWQLLGEAAPQRGIESPLSRERGRGRGRGSRREHHDCALAKGGHGRQDLEIEARFARFQEVLRAVRDIRTRQNVPPRKEVHFSVRCDADAAELLQPMEPYFVKMADCAADWLGTGRLAAQHSANVALTGMEVFVDLAELIDVEAELQRKRQEAVPLEGLIAAKQKKLENANFVQRRPRSGRRGRAGCAEGPGRSARRGEGGHCEAAKEGRLKAQIRNSKSEQIKMGKSSETIRL